MSFEVLEEKLNPLLHRREAKLIVHHEGQGTPDRITVRKLASQHFKTDMDKVYVRSIATRTGGSTALCMVEAYDDTASAKIVPAYLKNRNLPKEQRVSKKKGEEAKPAAAPPPSKLAVAPAKPTAAPAKPADAPKKPAAEKKTEEPAKKPEKKEEAKPTPKDSKPQPKQEAKQ